MAFAAPFNWSRIVLSGVLAGIVGGIFFDAFVYLASLVPAHASILSLWQFVASTALGRVAFASASYAWAGAAMHFAVSICWGIGYAYTAQTKPAINKQPLISGFIFGLVVYVVMQFVLFSVQALKVPDLLSVYVGGTRAHRLFRRSYCARCAPEMIGGIRVSLDAIARNARALRDLVAPAKAAFVVKGNAYGHGIVPVARTVEAFAHRLCVYSFDEAAVLRDAGITRPIFVMGAVESAHLEEAFARNVEISLWDTRSYLRAVANAARKRNARAAVHVKIDTGTTRLGLDPRDAPDAIEDYARLQELDIAGIFSHLAAAEELDSTFTVGQLDAFNRVVEAVDHTLLTRRARPVRHIAASAAAMLWPQTRLDMVRIGIALYGLWPSPQTRTAMNGARFGLHPALSLHSSLVAVRTVEAGTPVGYGGSYHAPKRTRIGVVPLGYADGIPRALSNRGAFLTAGQRCPIAGRVCMNMTMIDLAAAPEAKPGDEVVLLGRQDGAEVSADEWGQWADTINYEIVTRLPVELPRAYAPLPE